MLASLPAGYGYPDGTILDVAVTDTAVAFRSFQHAITTAVAIGWLATGNAGTVVCTTVAVLARIADAVIVAGCLTCRIAAAVGIVTVGGAIAVIVVAVGAADLRIFIRCTTDYFDTLTVIRTALPFTGRFVVADILAGDVTTNHRGLRGRGRRC